MFYGMKNVMNFGQQFFFLNCEISKINSRQSSHFIIIKTEKLLKCEGEAAHYKNCLQVSLAQNSLFFTLISKRVFFF